MKKCEHIVTSSTTQLVLKHMKMLDVNEMLQYAISENERMNKQLTV